MKTFITSCVNSTAELIGTMVDNAHEITYKTLVRHVGTAALNELFPFYADVPGLSLENDYSVSFYKSQFDGHPCVYVVHSAIEYVFV